MAWQKKLCGLAEAATILGVSDGRVGQFAHEDPLFPQELDGLRCGRVWKYEDIEQYRVHRELLLAAKLAAKQELSNGTRPL